MRDGCGPGLLPAFDLRVRLHSFRRRGSRRAIGGPHVRQRRETYRSCHYRSDELRETDQIVGRHGEGEGPLHTWKAPKCGLSPCSAQIRCTLVWLTPISSAIVRTLQWVAAAGCSFTVFSTILSLIAALIGFLPGVLVRPLMRPPTPASTKYSCQRQTVVFETPASRMIAMTPWPSALMSTILARLAIF